MGIFFPLQRGHSWRCASAFRTISVVTGCLGLLIFLLSAYSGALAQCSTPGCLTNAVNVSTGFDHFGGALYPLDEFDGFWEIDYDSDTTTCEIRNAVAVAPMGVPPPLPGSQWLGRDGATTDFVLGLTSYRTFFCACGPGGMFPAQIALDVQAQASADIFLNGSLIGTVPPGGGVTTIFTIVTLNTGSTNELRITVDNTAGPVSGVNVAGSITTPGGPFLQARTCCPMAFQNCIEGYVFDDDDGDGVQGIDEGPLEDATIQISLPGGGMATVTTNAAGRYWFRYSIPGTYTVVLPPSDDYEITAGDTFLLPLGPGKGARVLRSRGRKCRKIVVFKWNDRNCNQKKDPDEPWLTGWTIKIAHGHDTCSVVTTDTINGNSVKICGGLKKASAFEEPQSAQPVQSCWHQTAARIWWNHNNINKSLLRPNTIQFTRLSQNKSIRYLYFGNSSTGTLTITKFEDWNANGVCEPPLDYPLPNWVFTIKQGSTVIATVTTGTNGVTSASLVCGTYTVCETLKPGWCAVTSTCTTVIVTGCSVTSATFANTTTGQVCGIEYNDLNGNGFKDPGEPGLPGWTIQLVNLTTATVVASAITDATGNYCIIAPAGTYKLQQVGQSCWVKTQPAASGYTINLGCKDQLTNDFGNRSLGTSAICITKFNDMNYNGKQDGGESTLPGWEFILISGTTTMKVTTGTTGVTCATVTAGTWNITEVTRAGWKLTSTTSSFLIVSVTCATTSVAFGNASTGTLSITKFNDLNCSGKQDAGESALPGWEFTLTSGATVVRVTTGTLGSTSATVLAGTWKVTEVTRAGWRLTTTTGTFLTVTVGMTSSVSVTFGNVSTGTVSITKFNDSNNNKKQDAGESALPGWEFTLTSGATVVRVTTGTTGIALATVTAGTWKIAEVTQAGWQVTTTTATSLTVVVSTCSTVNVTFGNRQVGCTKGTICITKFHDMNCNGVQDVGESLLPGWEFTLSSGATIIKVTTGTAGMTCATVAIGTWKVAEVTRAGWQLTTTTASFLTVVVGTCSTVPVVFGNASTGTLCITKFNDGNCNGVQDAGESGLAGWEFTLTSGATVVRVTTGTAGVVCATVTAGTWSVCEVTQAGWQATTPVCVTRTIATCGSVSVSVGNSSTGTVCGSKYNDYNNNGIRDGEPGLSSWEIHLTHTTTGQMYTAYTDVDGNYCFTVPAGNYTLVEVQQAGWTQTQPLSGAGYSLTIAPCSSVSGYNFGNNFCSTATLCIAKFNDLNCDGIQEESEPPLAGWQFTATLGATSIPLTTDAGGSTCATVTPGVWTICEVTQVGWTPTTPACVTLAIATCETVSMTFGNGSTGTICATKFDDPNLNFIWDPGEAALPGWTITVMTPGPGGIPVTSAVTGPTGSVCLTVPAGTYDVYETLQDCWIQTYPLQTTGLYYHTVTVASCSTTDVLFGNTSMATLCITKYNDLDCNGTLSSGDQTMAGWEFVLTPSMGTPITVTTATDGRACTALSCGTYTICEVTQPGWTPTWVTCQTISVVPAVIIDLYFLNSSIGTLCVTKFYDQNGNGVQDGNEQGISGWPFLVMSTTGSVVATMTTDSTGMVCIPLALGTYTVCEVTQACWYATTPTTLTVTITGCQTTSVTFGNNSTSDTGMLCIMKFDDTNCNGIQDGNEQGINGWSFLVQSTTGSIVTSATTDSTGMVCLSLTSGTYTVCEVTQAGWKATTPVCRTVTILPCRTTNVNFGNSSTGTLCIVKFDDLDSNGIWDPGEPGIGNWSFIVSGVGPVITGPGGIVCVHTTAGTYTVCEVTQPGWVPTTPTCQTVTVTTCAGVQVTFGNKSLCTTGTVCILKFNDLNCNGIQDPGEPGIPGWQFIINGLVAVPPVFTNSNGVACVSLPPGAYTVQEVIQPCWSPTTPTMQPLNVLSCNTMNLMFGNSSTGTLCITKFNDLNCNGIQDPGEPGIAGWTFTATSATGTFLTATTGPNGTVCVPATCGTYTVCEVTRACWYPTTPVCQIATVMPCSMVAVAFGNSSTGTLCVTKCWDTNNNGRCDSTEPPIPDWPILVNGVLYTTGVTGTACIPVTCGTYTVCEMTKPGWTPTIPLCTTVTITPCTTVSVTFANTNHCTAALICVTKFDDKNCNATWDPGEPAVAGWPIMIPALGIIGQTGPNGTVCFSVPPGVYQVQEGILPCWVQTYPVNITGIPFHTVSVTACSVTNLLFGNSSTGTLCILKFQDDNGNGIQDPGEVGIPGWQIVISSIGTVMTDPSGLVCIPATCGTYTVCEVMQPGWQATTVTCTTITVVPCAIVNATFGNQPLPSAPLPASSFTPGERNGMNGEWQDVHLRSVPNPTSGETMIFFLLSDDGEIRLELYNTLGKAVYTLEQGFYARGQYKTRMDVHELPAGVYHLRLMAGGRVYSVPVIVQ